MLFIYLCPFFAMALMSIKERDSDKGYRFIQKMTENELGKDATIVSNVPVIVGWYSQRKCVFFPNSIEQLLELDTKYLGIDAILITNDLLSSSRSKTDQDWIEIMNNPPPTIANKYKLVSEFKRNSLTALLYKKIKKEDHVE
jgi:hypothetical protein